MECGIVLDNQNIWLLFEEKEKEEQEIPSNIPRKRKFGEKNTYKRRVHFMERFSQFFGKEPDLDYEDKKIIKKYHDEYLKLNPFYKALVESGSISKKDIQKLLRFIDRKENSKKFCRLYLEKWVSIAFEICWVRIPHYTDEEYVKVGLELLKFSNLWDELYPPSIKINKEEWYFPNRKHFPNINFAIQQIHNYLGLEKYNKYFPIPTTNHSLKKLKYYWNLLEEKMGYSKVKKLKQLTISNYFPTKK